VPLLATAAVYVHANRRGKFDVWAELLAHLQMRGDEYGLDMGCGRGAVMAMVARLVPRGHAVGLDLWRTEDQSGNNLEVTRRNLIAEGVAERCELKTGDMLAMPFENNTFDLVVSSLAIHNIDERDLRNHRRRLQAVSEAARVLKPGGRLLITDLLWTRRYARHLRQFGMHNVEQGSLGWRLPAYETPSGPDVVGSTEPEPVPAAPGSHPPESGAALSDAPETTPPAPEALPSPSTPTVSADSPFGDTPPEEARATTPADRFALTPTAANSRAGRYLKTSRQRTGQAGDQPGAVSALSFA
jgi:SAM-dependent methyltransferase